MKEETLDARRNHLDNLKVLFPNINPALSYHALYKKLRAIENRFTRMSIKACNGDITAEELEAEDIKAFANLILILGHGGAPIYINQDPRGYALKIPDAWMRENRDKNLHTDMGGYGIIAPEISD